MDRSGNGAGGDDGGGGRHHSVRFPAIHAAVIARADNLLGKFIHLSATQINRSST